MGPGHLAAPHMAAQHIVTHSTTHTLAWCGMSACAVLGVRCLSACWGAGEQRSDAKRRTVQLVRRQCSPGHPRCTPQTTISPAGSQSRFAGKILLLAVRKILLLAVPVPSPAHLHLVCVGQLAAGLEPVVCLCCAASGCLLQQLEGNNL